MPKNNSKLNGPSQSVVNAKKDFALTESALNDFLNQYSSHLSSAVYPPLSVATGLTNTSGVTLSASSLWGTYSDLMNDKPDPEEEKKEIGLKEWLETIK